MFALLHPATSNASAMPPMTVILFRDMVVNMVFASRPGPDTSGNHY
ncbi:hypothetical protein GCM10027436_02700 [Actinophytocola sediminis]